MFFKWRILIMFIFFFSFFFLFFFLFFFFFLFLFLLLLFFFSFLPYESQSLSLADIESQLIERLKASEPLWLVLNKSYEQKPYVQKRENDIVTLFEEQFNTLLKQWYEQTNQPSSFQIPPVFIICIILLIGLFS